MATKTAAARLRQNQLHDVVTEHRRYSSIDLANSCNISVKEAEAYIASSDVLSDTDGKFGASAFERLKRGIMLRSALFSDTFNEKYHASPSRIPSANSPPKKRSRRTPNPCNNSNRSNKRTAPIKLNQSNSYNPVQKYLFEIESDHGVNTCTYRDRFDSDKASIATAELYSMQLDLADELIDTSPNYNASQHKKAPVKLLLNGTPMTNRQKPMRNENTQSQSKRSRTNVPRIHRDRVAQKKQRERIMKSQQAAIQQQQQRQPPNQHAQNPRNLNREQSQNHDHNANKTNRRNVQNTYHVAPKTQTNRKVPKPPPIQPHQRQSQRVVVGNDKKAKRPRSKNGKKKRPRPVPPTKEHVQNSQSNGVNPNGTRARNRTIAMEKRERKYKHIWSLGIKYDFNEDWVVVDVTDETTQRRWRKVIGQYDCPDSDVKNEYFHLGRLIAHGEIAYSEPHRGSGNVQVTVTLENEIYDILVHPI